MKTQWNYSIPKPATTKSSGKQNTLIIRRPNNAIVARIYLSSNEEVALDRIISAVLKWEKKSPRQPQGALRVCCPEYLL